MPTYRSNTFRVTVGSQAWSYVGIQYPTEANATLAAAGYVPYPYDPFTIEEPADPSAWPTAEAVGYYYIDNTNPAATDTNNTYGYPDKPRATLPPSATDFSAGNKVVIAGGSYIVGGAGRWEWTFNGTAGNPCWLVGRGTHGLQRQIRLGQSSYLIVDGLQNTPALGQATAGPITLTGTHRNGAGGNNYVTVRNCNFVGDGSFTNGSVIGLSGAIGSINHHVVIYNNVISYFGDYTGPTENDMHGMKPSSYADFIWVIDNVIHHLGGDSIQIGNATTPEAEWVNHVYIGGNDFYNNFENGVDIKRCRDIIVSSNKLHDHNAVAFVAHNDGDWLTIINNDFYDSLDGAANTGFTNCSFVGNKFSNMVEDPAEYVADSAFSTGCCIYVRGIQQAAYFANNTFYNYAKGIQVQGGAAPPQHFISSNIFANRRRTDGYEIQWANSSNTPGTDTDYNLFYNPVFTTQFKWGTAIADLATYTSSLAPFDANSVVGDPQFTNVAVRDFSLGASSAAINVGEESPFYAAFQARYGIDVRKDILGTTRPQSSVWDIGAYERV